MKIAGNYSFEATCEEVWSAINDPAVLARTIPGCQRLDQVGENEFESTLKIGLQAVRGVYHGRVRLEDQQPPHHYKIVVDGKGSNGFMRGSGTIDLRQAGPNAILDYGGEAQIGGTIASVGQRLIDGAAKTLINQSLKALAGHIEARRTGVAEVDAPPAEAALVPALAVSANDAPPPPIVTVNASVAEPVTPALMPPSVAPPPPLERRSIVVPAHEQLSETDVALGVVDDFFKERPWLPWILVAFLVGLLLGRRRS